MKLDIVKNRFIFLALSAVLLLPGIVSMIYSTITYPTHTPLKVGIDYTGGTTLQYGVKEDISNNKLADVRTKLEKGGIDNRGEQGGEQTHLCPILICANQREEIDGQKD